MVYIPPPSKSAFIQLGDYVPKVGIYTNPGVVAEKKDDGTIVIDTNKDSIKQYHRHSITTGLTPSEKEIFNDIMDDVMSMGENSERIIELQKRIDSLKSTPKNKKVSDFLRNEQAQLIRWSKDLPRVYNTMPEKLR
ncbi:hypothetical protein QEJ31_12115 [Pigmentibacter sp. JX0631]|uniref:hypothetical protein n=1 Tax=Pigmentibacter sp. JX0631 TaxID=2976982 RepID=UPI0024687F75|nr:hypothetical protein [Pigmentibacter sp. JX0631]WGL59267.1 hypothetical protein QEJ31_12115 [Pigmentibacter sp. JX0631]